MGKYEIYSRKNVTVGFIFFIYKGMFLSLGAIFKNEAFIMEEWISHYIDEGVEHFYLIDNGSTDNYKEILDKFGSKITLFVDPKRHAQAELYNKYFKPVNRMNTWMIIVYLDEFMYSRKPYKTISEYLKTLPPNISSVSRPMKDVWFSWIYPATAQCYK
jgi:hypothetical protein